MPVGNWNASWRFGVRVKANSVCIDPQDIGFVQYPEFFWQRGHSKKRISVFSGDWDRVIDGRLYWSGKYEKIAGVDVGMLPIENFVFFSSAKAHFLNNVRWEDTEWVHWVSERRIRRYRTEDEIRGRLELLDRLYEACISGEFMVSKDDLPLVNIGREGRVSLDDGRHRLCVAIVAGLRGIPVAVSTIHPEAVSSKYGRMVLEKTEKAGLKRVGSNLLGIGRKR